MLPTLVSRLQLVLLLWLLTGPVLAQAVRPAVPQHRIPDPALRRLLARQGFLTNGVLNEKSRRWDQLHISGEGIKSLDGIQYFIRVEDLQITHTRLRRLDFMPPNVRSLDCSGNELVALPPLPPYLQALGCAGNRLIKLPPLPAYLRGLSCDDNRLTELPPLPTTLSYLSCGGNQLTALPLLPPSLETLHIGRNHLTRLPPLPPNLTVLNYFNNPIPDSDLPAAYRPLPCRTTTQNCQPNTLVKWPILRAQIPDTTFEIKEMQVVTNSDENMTGGTSKETVSFQPWGDYLVAGSQRHDRHDESYNPTTEKFRKRDTTYFRPVNYVVEQTILKRIIKDIYANRLLIALRTNDTLHTVDLRYKNLTPANAGSCSDCGNQEIDFYIRTTGAPIHLHYTIEFMTFHPISEPPQSQPQVSLLDWLYMYKLTQAAIPKNSMVKWCFRDAALRDILRWAR